MTELHIRQPAPSPTAAGAMGRALTGGLIMAVALGVGNGLGPVLAGATGASGLAARLIAAALVTVVAVPFVLRLSHPRAVGFGNPGASLRAFLTGVGVTAAAAALVLGAGTAVGLLVWQQLDLVTLVGFLVTNTAVAFLLEALPEETTLRGYTWTSLRGRFGPALAVLGTTAVFLLVPGTSTVVTVGIARLAGDEPGHIGIAPVGQHPVDYLILLTVFSLALIAARAAVGHAPLWAAIGTHLTVLTVNRIMLQGEDRDAGVTVEQTSGDAVLLVPLYLLVVAIAFLAYRRVTRRHTHGEK
ncbi:MULTISPECIES: type II CAAX prenyl endopeptidase Rce1 family protein [unclassified Streptomyces]|uniref:CPBP family glutamic-type intramembrane protease n=1 Tax=unclassified Streptomyces TaxID=2593676 RepID=UPI000B1903AA|nr:CPBP family glutamic-type intramembrane protease [Streptomyces sp. TSRI0281]